mmetsp:Transcript_32793/g.64281  ORF Transcript_32793/g.64281 Transcript_32793/m.64281 type:complete len:269 (-) Transcript_32793:79-885(-)
MASSAALLTQMARAGFTGALIVQPINYGFDHAHVTAVLDAQARSTAPVLRGMCLADPTLPPEDACRFLEDRAQEGYVAVRFNPYLWPEAAREQGWLADASGTRMFAAAGRLQMPVGVMAFKGLLPLLPSLEALMAAHPETLVVLDHLGFVRQSPAEPPSPALTIDQSAFGRLLQLAAYPQVHVKLSALFRVSRRGGLHDYDDMPSLFDQLLQAYGAHRIMWGSDFPFVQLQPGGYTAAMAAVTGWCAGLAPAEAAAVLGGTAARLFRF